MGKKSRSTKKVWTVLLCENYCGGRIKVYAVIKGSKEKAEEWALEHIINGDARWKYINGVWERGTAAYIDIEEHNIL